MTAQAANLLNTEIDEIHQKAVAERFLIAFYVEFGWDTLRDDKRKALGEALLELCQKAIRLALFFRRSHIEYMWQMEDTSSCTSPIVVGTEVSNSTTTSKYNTKIVFGNVVRGDRATGHLKNGTFELCPAYIIK